MAVDSSFNDTILSNAPVLSVLFILAYLVGSIPTGYIVAKQLKGIDIREHGSGNVGATNVRRVVGKNAGLFVLIFDFFKGFIPVFAFPFVISWLQGEGWFATINDLYMNDMFLKCFQIVLALAASFGHSRSIFLNFSGGKAAITTLGGLLALNILAGAITGIVAYLIIKITRYVSLGSIIASICAPIFAYLLNGHIFQDPASKAKTIHLPGALS
ncbi:MAG: glycerol-3-phosphate 1-O-acyltransferase PlsY, partial [Cyanobacteria bacterium]|nr:glycerol-3-phosphate 1-O-acyltransferase PlsY [Cyanobacteriota bacterium]